MDKTKKMVHLASLILYHFNSAVEMDADCLTRYKKEAGLEDE
jgi:hypothetical protein